MCTDAASYLVSIDPTGEVAWKSGTFCRPGRADAHVIEVLSEQAPSAYRSYLRERGVSFITAGKNGIDLASAAQQLRECFGIEHLLVCGGGITDATFLAAGLIDELSIVVAPVASGERGVATVFDALAPDTPQPRTFTLGSVTRTDGDGLHLVYRA